MTVIIPLAGRGTRLRPLSWSIPKPLLPCGGDTVLGWIFKSIKTLSPEKIVLVIGYKGDLIRDWVNKNYGNLPVEWVVQEEPEGLGQAVWEAGRFVLPESEVLIYLGDTIFDLDWSLIKAGKENIIGVRKVKDPERFGIVKVKGDKVLDLVEKPANPPSNLAVVGLYYIKKWKLLHRHLDLMIEKGIKTQGEYQLTDGLKYMLKKENIDLKTLLISKWYDCGTIDSLLVTNSSILKDYSSWFQDKNPIENHSYISCSSKLEDSNIGPFVTIGQNSFIESSDIRNSIVGDTVKIVNSDIYDSVIGNGSEIVNVRGKVIVGSNSVFTGKEN